MPAEALAVSVKLFRAARDCRIEPESVILTFLAFGPKMLYLCNSGAGLSMRKSRFFCVFEVYFNRFQPYFP